LGGRAGFGRVRFAAVTCIILEGAVEPFKSWSLNPFEPKLF
jgi:hypothetical protein